MSTHLLKISLHSLLGKKREIADFCVQFQIQSDKPGCDANCSCFAEGSLEDHFIVGRNDVSIAIVFGVFSDFIKFLTGMIIFK